ncbi:hypothetical protein AB7M22_002280 [Pseudomonas sp. ADAK2 TE3594]
MQNNELSSCAKPVASPPVLLASDEASYITLTPLPWPTGVAVSQGS